jgi:WD repeat-containing protein 34
MVSDISWNSTGVIVAAGYSACDHDSTCSHKSMICYWGIFKRNFKPTKP